VSLTFIDWIIMLVYFAFVLGIGFVLKRRVKTSTDFFPGGPGHSSVDLRVGIPVGHPGRTGSDRNGRLRRKIWHRDKPFLLDRGLVRSI
jgi:hypothetical protein